MFRLTSVFILCLRAKSNNFCEKPSCVLALFLTSDSVVFPVQADPTTHHFPHTSA